MVQGRIFLKGHIHGFVRSVAFSPDGRTLASAGDDTSVRLWDMATGTEKVTLRGHRYPIWCIAFSPDGKTLASGGGPLPGEKPETGELILWDVTNSSPRSILQGLRGSVRALSFSANGKALVSGGGVYVPDLPGQEFKSSGELRLWDVATGEERTPFKRQESFGLVVCVAFAPDGKTLAVGRSFTDWELWEANTYEPKTRLSTKCRWSVAFSPDSKTVAVDCELPDEEEVRLYEVATGQLKGRLPSETHHHLALAFSPDGKTLAVGRYLEDLELWDVPTQSLKEVVNDSQYACSVAFSPDAKIMASGSGNGGVVRVWHMPTENEAG